MTERPTLRVIKPGLQSSVQDLGRPGWRHLGIGQAGAMDAVALQQANALLGQDLTLPALEISGGPLELRVERDTLLALSGADFEVLLDGSSCPVGWVHLARAGQRLRLHGPRAGRFAYLALPGGMATAARLGACSTDLAGGFGGLHGRALQGGDGLEAAALATALPEGRRRGLPPFVSPAVLHVRVLPGPEAEGFHAEAMAAFWQADWRVSPRSNRMGSRLDGPALRSAERPDDLGELLSHAVLPGVVQVPPDGQPIVLAADAQATGGYPRLAVVIEADLPRLAQAGPGQRLRFLPVDEAEARAARRQSRDALHLQCLALRGR
ncbi:biotin-dependent carboxyltransferase family protein [Pelomonas sp. APW6]|uniref:Biotin-dependent carboxyltransferase family protein n=1 Tax=Roseateles subflavus TaxID=3053353 RepID=A0ABT7LG71_9BURK|nr:biotin-dependent carboxyltransferase family protein [Pelomonas sp. APW6]MDL5031287.1 biotin-dependent carboxyltransferase family protein [Pelomonas sp. APW6]